MLNELILLGTTLTVLSVFLTGCSSKKAAPSVAPSPVANTPQSPASVSNTSVTKSTATDTETKTGAETKTGGETKTSCTGDVTKDKDDDDKKEDKKDDEKKEDNDDKKKDSDEKNDEKKEDTKGSKTKKKEIFSKSFFFTYSYNSESIIDFSVCADPSELCFDSAITSQKKLRLKNLSGKKLMFKIKATTTNIYLINPVFGTIEPNNFADVMITHRPSGKREDKLVIVSSEMLGKEIEMAKTFKQIKTTGADVTVKLVAA
ncbi:hypothetical protein CAEBREN_10674 [Caenorhabditis brenneri]|uniref:Major sperm protein n=1 Tax=Caenorhabditis brenneri TaxID=135651 RepID=G0ML45_CAEBE|nr:hypothetical protein CAEBREN_10674 [Caenorhabditis brenneri]